MRHMVEISRVIENPSLYEAIARSFHASRSLFRLSEDYSRHWPVSDKQYNMWYA